MATYKSGYKRSKGNDKFLLYMLIGFAIVVVGLIIGVIIYNAANPDLDYSSFEDVHIENFRDVTTIDDTEYIVYFYGVNCGYCKDIKYQVLNFAETNNQDIKVYMLESATPDDWILDDNGTQTTEDDYYRSDIKDPHSNYYMRGTPAMVTVKNGVVIDMVVGPDLILSLIDSVEEETYGLLN